VLEPWLALPGLEARFRAWSDLLEVDLVALGTSASAEEMRETRYAQRLIFATSVVIGGWLQAELEITPASMADELVLAGHSIGEWSAAALAGVLSPEDAGRLVGVRADAMDAQCRAAATGLVALIGCDVETARTIAAQYDLHLANVNAAAQTVIGGSIEAIDRLAASPPEGVRTRRLEVAGAFHTPPMEPAVDVLAAAAASAVPGIPSIPVVSNLDGAVVRDGGELLARLVRQVAAPVRWDLCTRTFGELDVDVIVELEPAGVLAGLARRALPDATVIAVKSPDQLDEVRNAIPRVTETEGVRA
jgi:[acyl-carrier-protein] S-malonyltransferase